MTHEGQGNVPKPIQDEIAAEERLASMYSKDAAEYEAKATKARDLMVWHSERAERLRVNDWQAA